MNNNRVVHHSFGKSTVLNVSFDVGMDSVYPLVLIGEEVIDRPISNRSEEIEAFLEWVRAKAKLAGYNQLRIVAEATGVYHELLFRIAIGKRMETALVDPGAVKKIREAIFRDRGKTDQRDPFAIADLARRNCLIKHRRLPETYRALRRYHVIYVQESREMTREKCRIHRILKVVFPDLDFYPGFVYDKTGRAIMACYSFDPRAIRRSGLRRVGKRIKSHVPRVRQTTINRLLKYAGASLKNLPSEVELDARILELKIAWDNFIQHEERKVMVSRILEDLYDQARACDPKLPAPIKNVASKLNLARLVAETGPLSDFSSWRQVMKMLGVNLTERKSGKFKGKTKISKAGRARGRQVLNEMALSLVRKTRLFGPYYHHKREVEKMPGPVAMIAVARKLLKMFWGIYKSDKNFSAERVFSCQSKIGWAA